MKIAQWYHLSSVVCWAIQNLVGIICIKQETLFFIYVQYFSLMCNFIILVSDIITSRFLGLIFSYCHEMGMAQNCEEFTSNTEHSVPWVEGNIVHAPKDCAGFYSLPTCILTLELTFLRPLWLEAVPFVCHHGG